MIGRIRKHIRIIACFLALNLLVEVIAPNVAVALTGGPSQPEVQSFEPVGTSEMVDLFSGDFNYNIPLLDVDGYPVNIAYHAGIGMDDEASWVGLGWNINPGSINRNMRGLPDDFSGDEITKEFNMRPNRTYSLNTDLAALEVFGTDAQKHLNSNLGVRYNNYKGVGYNFGVTLNTQDATPFAKTDAFSGSLSASFDSENGLSISPSISYSKVIQRNDKNLLGGLNLSAGTSYSSRGGIKSMNYGGSFNPSVGAKESTIASEGEKGVRGINRKKGKLGPGGGGSLSFGTQTWVPSISMPMQSTSISLRLTGGGDAFGAHFAGAYDGVFSEQKLREKTINKKAYGYYYEHQKGGDDVLLDFNREKDGSFNSNSTNLPLAAHTYDVLSVSGHGVGGAFRSKRSDVGALHDDVSKTTGSSGSLGLEFGVGNVAHSGFDLMVNYNHSKSALWKKDNDLLKLFHFQESAYQGYEPFFFKAAGDVTPVDENFHSAMFGDRAIRPSIQKNGVMDGSFVTREGARESQRRSFPKNRNGNNIAEKRAERNQVMSFLNAEEASYFGLDKGIQSVDMNQNYIQGYLPMQVSGRVDNTKRKAHHMSEVSILQEGGMRYIYGIPAYTNFTLEKTFNIKNNTGVGGACETGEVLYEAGDNTKDNKKGLDHFFSSSKTPAYAYSYLLTGVVSPDYVDITNNGITDDDLGSAVKFNYTRARSAFRWRVPYHSYKGIYSEGLKSNSNDDKGSYSYGEKEIWYTHSIEGKNHVALFKISKREDALGVAGENGGKDPTMRQYKLDKIELYAKQDLMQQGSSATPIKTVHFTYDYSLCPNVENNTGDVNVPGNEAKGKLTLKEIYFTYGTSGKGRLNAYKFTYSTNNPEYHLRGHDAWGNYKLPPTDCCGHEANLSNSDFPYVEQNQTTTDNYMNAWNLTEIQLPSGGKIKVDYESDDYAYVQDQRAMQMLKIKGFGYEEDNVTQMSDGRIYDKQKIHDLVFFELQDPLTGSNAVDLLKEKYLNGIKDLQFTVFADINGRGNHEYVKGYAEINLDRVGVTDNGTTGWVAMKKVKIGDKSPLVRGKKVNPVAKAMWNFARMNAPDLVNNFSPTEAKSVGKQLLSLLGVFPEIQRMATGFNNDLRIRKFGKFFKPEKSWIRLLSPNRMKLGGGHRVKKIRISDNWAEMGSVNTGASDEEYGQEYDYTMVDEKTNETISSGVATFEPGIGRDENPLVQPKVITIENKLIPNEDILQEKPVGESFYPAPSVGYRQVTTKSLTKSGVKRTGTGKEVNEFYTAYDYPVIVSETKLKRESQKDRPYFSFVYSKRSESVTGAQGYVIELNDMHGKPKAQWSYSETSIEPISGTSFHYQEKVKKGKKCLENSVLQLKKDGTIIEREIGVDMDMVNDFRENKNKSMQGGLKVNSETMVLFIAPLFVPTILPSLNVTKNDVYTAVTTKVINRTGVLKEVKAFQEGAEISTKNLLYDAETGSLLLTSIQNEFKDNTYSFTQPAHWAYEGMGQAYKNIGMEFKGVSVTDRHIALPNGLNPNDYFFPGDEVMVTKTIGGSQELAYVYDGDDGILNLIDRNGKPYTYGIKGCELKILRSGRKNLHNSPIGSIITKTNPLVQTGNSYNLTFKDILSTEAMEYSNDWQTFVSYLPKLACDSLSPIGHDVFNLLNMLADQTDFFTTRYKIDPNKLIKGAVVPILYQDILGVKNVISEFTADDDNLFLRYGTEPYVSYNPFDTNSEYFDMYVAADNKTIVTGNLPSAINSYYANSDLSNHNDTLDVNCPPTGNFSRTWSGNLHLGQHCCDLKFNFPDAKTFKKINKFLSIQSVDKHHFRSYAEIILHDNSLDTVHVNGVTGFKGGSNLEVGEPCYDLFDCPPDCYNVFNEEIINPYRNGLKGNWHPLRAFKYLDGRNYDAANKDPRNDGIYSNYLPFWTYNIAQEVYLANTTQSDKWVWTSQTTKYTPFGNELETKDALGRYSSALFGYHYTTPIAVASNSKVSQIAYDGFEDYTFMNQYYLDECKVNHFNFSQSLTPWNGNVSVDEEEYHTGNRSLKIVSGNEAAITRQLEDIIQTPLAADPNICRIMKPSDDVGIFRPEPGKYIVSAWIKEDRTADKTSYNSAKIQVRFLYGSGSPTAVDLMASGPIVEGWQRVEAKITVPTNAQVLEMKLIAASDVTTWFDDVRFHPNDGNMVSYAYDSRTMKLLGQLDENNYATIYEYDAEGTLIRVKKESTKGVLTLKETRNHYHKK